MRLSLSLHRNLTEAYGHDDYGICLSFHARKNIIPSPSGILRSVSTASKE
jgi:hypothetical protein